ncbi:MAG TPA: hypothetical protein VHV75_04605 [Solirubrobacteraceae bacterium]|nr:hypothetical protein [Solirubrobacteraceae bacterium]
MQANETQTRESDEELYEIEVIDGEIVEHRQAPVEPGAGERLPLWASPPAVQAAVAAATGFLAGAATLALLRHYGRSRLEREAARSREPLPGSGRVHAYIVHVRPLRPYLD